MAMTKESVKTWLDIQTEWEYVQLWNQYCYNIYNYDDILYDFSGDIDEFFDDMLKFKTTAEIFNIGRNSDITWSDNWIRWRLDVLQTVKDPRRVVDEDALIEAIMENPGEYGYEPEFEQGV